MPQKIGEYDILLGTFNDNKFTWHHVESYKDLSKAYKAFKDYVNSQLKYTDEELLKVWNTGRLDIELRKGNQLLNWVGIYSREVDRLMKEKEDEKPDKKASAKDSVPYGTQVSYECGDVYNTKVGPVVMIGSDYRNPLDWEVAKRAAVEVVQQGESVKEKFELAVTELKELLGEDDRYKSGGTEYIPESYPEYDNFIMILPDKEILKEFEEGMTLEQLADKYSVGKKLIQIILDKEHRLMSRDSKIDDGKYKSFLKPDLKSSKNIIAEYCKGVSIDELSKKYFVAKDVVQEIIRKHFARRTMDSTEPIPAGSLIKIRMEWLDENERDIPYMVVEDYGNKVRVRELREYSNQPLLGEWVWDKDWIYVIDDELMK